MQLFKSKGADLQGNCGLQFVQVIYLLKQLYRIKLVSRLLDTFYRAVNEETPTNYIPYVSGNHLKHLTQINY